MKERIDILHLRQSHVDLLEACEPIAAWLSAFLERGEQLGNLDMRHAKRLLKAIRKATE